MDTYHFQLFENPGKGRREGTGGSTLSLTKDGQILFSKPFYQQNNISQFSYAYLYYDPSKRAIALVFTPEKTKEAYKITVDTYGRGASISAYGEMKRHDLTPADYQGRYTWSKQHIKGIGEAFIIELQERQ